MSLTVSNAARALLDCRTKYWCDLWRVTRTDGQQFHWTNHDEALVYPWEGKGSAATYEPALSLNLGTVRSQAGLRDSTTTVRAYINSDGVTAEDLRAGRWRDARVIWLKVNWLYFHIEEVADFTFTIGETRHTEEGWEAELRSISSRLARPQGIYLNRPCRFKFGGAFGKAASVVGCRYDRNSDADRAIPVTAVTDNQTFSASTLTSHADDYWNLGEVTWRTGNNVGLLAMQVKDYDDSSREITLALPTPLDIAVGDRFDVVRGCDRTSTSCTDRSQFANFGGFLHMPTEDDLRETPDARS